MSIRFIGRDGSEQIVPDYAQLCEAVKRGEIIPETLVYDDTKQTWAKARERFAEVWNESSPGKSTGTFFRRYALWVAYPGVIILFIISMYQLRLGDEAASLTGSVIFFFFIATLVLTAISKRWSEPIKQKIRYIVLLVFASVFVISGWIMYKQKMDIEEVQMEIVAAAKEPQLSEQEVMKRLKTLHEQRMAEEKKIQAEVESMALDKLFDPHNLSAPNAIERNRNTIERYKELISKNNVLTMTYQDEMDRLFFGQAVLASGQEAYQKKKKEQLI